MELGVVLLFFSVWLPAWCRVGSCMCADIARARDILYKHEEVDFLHWERLIFYINHVMDVIRFVYGRAILFRLSSPTVLGVVVP